MMPNKQPAATSTRVLFAASEAAPLIKTGGLGDVIGALPAALQHVGADVRLILPAYPQTLERAMHAQAISQLDLGLGRQATVLAGLMPGSGVPLWLIQIPGLFDRPGNPYVGPNGQDWPDNAERYAAFCLAITALALGQAGIDWQPEVVHSHDWQTGLVPALLSQKKIRPATVFTIHNLSYQGLFPAARFPALGLPSALWSPAGLEFYDQLSFIKGGLNFADRLTTVSPTYAREITTPEFGCGLDGLLRHRAHVLSGILNGVDYQVWDPRHDPHLIERYDANSAKTGKQANKLALQTQLGLPVDVNTPVFALISRLVDQKGIDLIIAALPRLTELGAQTVILGSGEKHYELAFQQLSQRHPQHIAVTLGYDETLSHRIEAGADFFLMPSRFEPCGLNQIYSLRYGTAPIVRRTGGLADTVIDATPQALELGTATGFVFDEPSPGVLLATCRRALALYQKTTAWQRLMTTGMTQDFGWQHSAQAYLEVYRQALAAR